MATKTEKLLAALLQRGYKEVEHIANATCLHGVTPHSKSGDAADPGDVVRVRIATEQEYRNARQ